MLAMSREDAVARSLGSSFEYLLHWPATADTPDAIRDQTFVVRHAWLTKVASSTCMAASSFKISSLPSVDA